MNPATKQLIAAIATIAKDKQVFLSKTKLLKLLYLFDVEYFRQHRSTFTGFAWKFFHLGPWTHEIDTILEDLIREEVLIARQSARPDFDSTTYVPVKDQQIGVVLSDIHDEFALKRVLNAWIDRQLGEILDHVYFHTEYAARFQHGPISATRTLCPSSIWYCAKGCQANPSNLQGTASSAPFKPPQPNRFYTTTI
jgi:hypothetical protein